MDLVGRKLGLRGGKALHEFVDGIGATATAAVAAGGELAEIGTYLGEAAAMLDGATGWLLANAPKDPNNAFAAATPYLQMAGLVTEAWVLTRGALAASALRSGDGGGFSDEFLDQKLVTARFFARQLLPEAPALLRAVTAGPSDLFDARF